MIGILGYAAYIPRPRLSRAAIAGAWGRRSDSPLTRGERAVAGHDEDSVTMAAEAAFRCLQSAGGCRPDTVYFASTTAPDQERAASGVIAAAADLPRETRTADFAGSLRAGTAALLAGLDAVKGGPAWSVLVAAADCRLAEPGQPAEEVIGDGAAAVVVGEGNALATVEATYTITEEFPSTWRGARDLFFRSGDEKFTATLGCERLLLDAMRGVLDNAKLAAHHLSKVVCAAPDLSIYTAVAKASGVPVLFLQDPLLSSVGFTGTACPLLLLATCLDSAEPGQLVLLLSVGGGADALLLSVTEHIEPHRSRVPRHAIGAGRQVPSYQTYLKYRGLVKSERERRNGEPFTSLTMLWRERMQNLALHGVRCAACERIFFPARRTCPGCGANDALEPHKLARRGTLVTFTADHLYPGPESPSVMAVIDLDGGGRLFTQMTDCEAQALHVGMAVELTLRKFHEANGYPHYFWKGRPVAIEP